MAEKWWGDHVNDEKAKLCTQEALKSGRKGVFESTATLKFLYLSCRMLQLKDGRSNNLLCASVAALTVGSTPSLLLETLQENNTRKNWPLLRFLQNKVIESGKDVPGGFFISNAISTLISLPHAAYMENCVYSRLEISAKLHFLPKVR